MSQKPNLLQRVDWMLVLVFILALLPRVTSLGLIEFKADEALTVLDIQQFFKSPHLIQYGLPSSVGARNFPLFHYLLLIPGLFSRDPRFLSGAIGFFNTIAIAGFYLITKRYYGKPVAIIASLLFATNPWSILLSRKIWAQDLIPLFSVPIFYFFHRWVKDQYQKAVIPLWILLVLGAQLHASGLFLAIVIGLYLLKKHALPLKQTIIGMMLGLLPAIPYAAFQLTAQPLCPDCRLYLDNAVQNIHAFDFLNLILPFTFLGGFGWGNVMGQTDLNNFLRTYPLSAIAYGAFIAQVGYVLVGLWRLYKQKYDWITVIIAGLPILYLMMQVPARLHYFQVIAPWLMVTTTIGIAAGLKHQVELVWIGLIFIVTAQLLFMGMFFHYLSVHRFVSGDYGTIYSQSKIWVDETTSAYQTRPDYVVIRTMAHFDTNTVHAKGPAMIHLRLAQYFYTQQDMDLVKQELKNILKLEPDNQQVKKTLLNLESQ